jgi:translation initiation factor eIF-2B subunit delta
MDPFDHIRRAAADRGSGSVAIAARAARGLAVLDTTRDVLRAASALLKAHPAMGALWRLLAVAYEARDRSAAVPAFMADLESDTDAAADAIRWVATRRSMVIVTHSDSASVRRALRRVKGRIALVRCTMSLPGGEGRALARKLGRDGLPTEMIGDAEVALACADADLVLVGADAVTEDAVVNKVGTAPLVLAASEAGIGAYAIAAGAKLLPSSLHPDEAPRYEPTSLRLFDAVLTERGPRRPVAVRRAVARVRIPPALARLAP